MNAAYASNVVLFRGFVFFSRNDADRWIARRIIVITPIGVRERRRDAFLWASGSRIAGKQDACVLWRSLDEQTGALCCAVLYLVASSWGGRPPLQWCVNPARLQHSRCAHMPCILHAEAGVQVDCCWVDLLLHSPAEDGHIERHCCAQLKSLSRCRPVTQVKPSTERAYRMKLATNRTLQSAE